MCPSGWNLRETRRSPSPSMPVERVRVCADRHGLAHAERELPHEHPPIREGREIAASFMARDGPRPVLGARTKKKSARRTVSSRRVYRPEPTHVLPPEIRCCISRMYIGDPRALSDAAPPGRRALAAAADSFAGPRALELLTADQAAADFLLGFDFPIGCFNTPIEIFRSIKHVRPPHSLRSQAPRAPAMLMLRDGNKPTLRGRPLSQDGVAVRKKQGFS